MARPHKPGLEYFPKDSNMLGDRKIRRLMSVWGLKGLVVYEYLLCLIYGDQGYFIRYDSNLAFDVADYLKNDISETDVKSIVVTCLDIDLFDQDRFKSLNVLTSSGIQNRYLKAKRGGVIAKEYEVVATETRVIAAITTLNSAISTQSKVKEIKEQDSKGILAPVGAEKEGFKNKGDPIIDPKKENAPPVAPRPPKSETRFDLVSDKLGVIKCKVLAALLKKYDDEHPNAYPSELYTKFLVYWSQPNERGRPKWIVEQDRKGGTFHIPGRLSTFKQNDFTNKPTSGNGKPGTLRPTSIGSPNYRGKGSDCDVEL
ncbi:DUF4373 domain-containing protein [Dyadobacter sp. CY261]|uniref:DUF4373 domain-containing protein n=1 Tax=Dyadobacter sp. CY261 TaxID=2907203 RepID=UPI001F32DDB4|nr:DUF4373 domain-containing protein [Dyadobacter sp. CY261]MCF0070253.1 DUF4373 domain-containing protein [Dyadobacter sp. CY261]